MAVQADRLRQAREEAGLSQAQLAQRIGAHFTSVSDWEREEHEPRSRHVESIARETGKPVEWFYGTDDEEREATMALLAAIERVVDLRVNRRLQELPR